MNGLLYDTKIPLRLKSSVYEAVIRSAVTYGSYCWAMEVNNKRTIATTDMRMLRGIVGMSRQHRVPEDEDAQRRHGTKR